jgi:hypothetical protein
MKNSLQIRAMLQMKHLRYLEMYQHGGRTCSLQWFGFPWLSGVAVSTPTLSVLSIQLPYTTFRSMLQCYSSLSRWGHITFLPYIFAVRPMFQYYLHYYKQIYLSLARCIVPCQHHYAHWAGGSLVVDSLCYNPEGREFDSRWIIEFYSIYLTLPAAL